MDSKEVLENAVNQAISDFDSIEAAIESKGVTVEDGTDTSEYGNLIRSIVGEGVDLHYNPNSIYAQSGKAVAEAISDLKSSKINPLENSVSQLESTKNYAIYAKEFENYKFDSTDIDSDIEASGVSVTENESVTITPTQNWHRIGFTYNIQANKSYLFVYRNPTKKAPNCIATIKTDGSWDGNSTVRDIKSITYNDQTYYYAVVTPTVECKQYIYGYGGWNLNESNTVYPIYLQECVKSEVTNNYVKRIIINESINIKRSIDEIKSDNTAEYAEKAKYGKPLIPLSAVGFTITGGTATISAENTSIVTLNPTEKWALIGFPATIESGKSYLIIWKGTPPNSFGVQASGWHITRVARTVTIDGTVYKYGIVHPTESVKQYIYVHTGFTVGTPSTIELMHFAEYDSSITTESASTDNDVINLIEQKSINIFDTLNELTEPKEWEGKKALVIGDSLTAAGVWQTKLNSMLGMDVTTHAKGGSGMVACIDGNGSDFPALTSSDVADKDLIIFFAGYNDRGRLVGDMGDTAAASGTYVSMTKYIIEKIYALLSSASNLTCRVIFITPHCAGKYSYIPYDGYSEYPVGSGQTLETIANTIEAVATSYNIPCYNAWKYSGINKFTWEVYAASSTAMTGETVNDQLHLNNSKGYPHLGECIAKFVRTI